MDAGRTSVIVAVCTFRRNEPLACLIEAVLRCADHVRHRATVGMVVVDDVPAGEARATVAQYADRFELGLHYRISGRQNISIARNLALDTAVPLGDWIAMTDDDCEPVDTWLAALLDVQNATHADAVTGQMLRRAPATAAGWLREQPFLTLGLESPPDRADMPTAFTNNVLIRSAWLRQSGHRFEPDLGVIGGEDMVFFRTAKAGGLQIRFSEHASVFENEPPVRLTLRYQLGRFFWYGNSSYVTSLSAGTSRSRMVIHGGAIAARGIVRPFRRMAGAQTPQFRYALAMLMQAAGIVVGSVGVRVPHH